MEQTAGRGRQGRNWHSPMGTGIYFSVLLRPAAELREWNAFSLAVGTGIGRAIADVFRFSPELKWPNDLVSGGRKLGGILCETRAAQPGALVVGIGLNLLAPPAGWPEELGGSATSVGERAELDTVEAAQVDEIFVSSLTQLERAYHLFAAKRLAPFLADLHERDALAGRRIRFRGPNGEELQGRALRVEGDGCLRIESNGKESRLFAGEVHLLAEQD
jgi:BirA family biotin operon repressor/biotin-[acetyl-CoA-carboxylase] ligase